MIFIIGLKIFISKIEITSDGLKWKLFKKELKVIIWDDVVNVNKSYIAGTQSLSLSLISGDTFSFNVNKKIIKSIVFYCNNNNLKEKFEKIRLVF